MGDDWFVLDKKFNKRFKYRESSFGNEWVVPHFITSGAADVYINKNLGDFNNKRYIPKKEKR